MKKIIFLLILVIVIPIDIKAACDPKELATLRKIANNVNLSYEYNSTSPEYMRVVINNITPNIYIVDELSKTSYTYNQSTNGQVITARYSGIEKVKFSVYSTSATCPGVLLTKSIELPVYNRYYTDKACVGAEGYKYCNKWTPYDGTYEEFVNNVNKYKESLKKSNDNTEVEMNMNDTFILFELYVKYYYIVLPLIIIVGVIVIYRYNKKNRFDLGKF